MGLNDYVNVGLEFRYFFVRKTCSSSTPRRSWCCPAGSAHGRAVRGADPGRTGKITKFPIVLVGPAYWSGPAVLAQDNARPGQHRPGELALIHVADEPGEVVDIIREAHNGHGLIP